MKVAFLFPGQGSESIGMGEDILARYATAMKTYKIASEISGLGIDSLSFAVPLTQSEKKENVQLAIVTMSLAVFNVLSGAGIKPTIAAGHSLGEYSALIASGALSIEEGTGLVKIRGQIMSKSNDKNACGMAAINGISFEQIKAICNDASKSAPVYVANYNSPRQIVISGTREGIDIAIKLSRKYGAKTIYLPVNGAFHSPLMEKAALEFSEAIKGVEVRDPVFPVMGGISASLLSNTSLIREEIINHMLSPVRWYDCILNMFDMGIQRFVEVGPGNVLKGLILRINRKAEVFTTGTVEDLNITIERLLSELKTPDREAYCYEVAR
jgi:[acyl-carrier-protein] S-malonyltransferase